MTHLSPSKYSDIFQVQRRARNKTMLNQHVAGFILNTRRLKYFSAALNVYFMLRRKNECNKISPRNFPDRVYRIYLISEQDRHGLKEEGFLDCTVRNAFDDFGVRSGSGHLGHRDPDFVFAWLSWKCGLVQIVKVGVNNGLLG